MGSLTSRPKIPASPQVVYMPVPAAGSPPATTPTTSPSTPAETEAEARSSSLLLRDRGIFGTVLTGFRGLLAPGNNVSGRKTLLGE